jgi:hypothetical protein
MLFSYIRAVAIFFEAVGHGHFEFCRCCSEEEGSGRKCMRGDCLLHIARGSGLKYCIFTYVVCVILSEGVGNIYLYYFEVFVLLSQVCSFGFSV